MNPLSQYTDIYTPSLLQPIPRAQQRRAIGIDDATQLPFKGCDVWNAYELSWLNPNGKPLTAVAEFLVPCNSINIIESKSLKLYLNSFNQTPFDKQVDVVRTLESDLSVCTRSPVFVNLYSLQQTHSRGFAQIPGENIDGQDIKVDEYQINAELLEADPDRIIKESLHSHLLKSNCPMTGLPDWGSLAIEYVGPAISKPSLLKYIISYRQHGDFHENCIERIFVDIMAKCQPEKLSISGFYLRRGGIDINPFRSNHEDASVNLRLARQ